MHRIDPIDEDHLEQIRAARRREVEMWSVVKELVVYTVFIILIYIVSYGNRDPNSYRFQELMQNNFILRPGFDRIRTSNDWWQWAHTTVVDQLRAQSYYNGHPPYGLRGYIGDKTNRILGHAVLRQIRVKPNSCRVDKRVRNVTQECAQGSMIINEDDKVPLTISPF